MQTAKLARRKFALNMSKKLTFCLAIAFCVPTFSVGAATVYVYKDQKGRTLISNHPNHDRSLKLIRSYQPRSAVHALGPRHYNYSQRRLDPRSTDYDQTIFHLADSYQQDRALIKAIIQIESSFNPQAVSPKGAQGLMQLMPATANSYEVSDPFDVQDNLRGGIKFFAHLMKRYNNDVRLALAAYNAGETAVAKYNGVPPFPETQSYVKHVLRLHKNYQKHAGTYQSAS